MVAIEKRAFRSPSTKFANFTYNWFELRVFFLDFVKAKELCLSYLSIAQMKTNKIQAFLKGISMK